MNGLFVTWTKNSIAHYINKALITKSMLFIGISRETLETLAISW